MISIAEIIRRRCRELGPRPALSLGGADVDVVTYEQLGRYADNVCGRLRRMGVAPGSLFGLVSGELTMHIALTLALDRLGAVSVLLQDLDLARGLNLTAMLSAQDFCQVVRVNRDWLSSGGEAETSVPERPVSPDDICRIAFTSGSTGAPKAIAITRGVLAARLALFNVAARKAANEFPRLYCGFGINVSAGYRILLRTLAEGGLFCFPDPVIPRAATRIAHHGVETLMGSPYQLADIASFAERNPGSFPTLQLVTCGGSRAPGALVERVRQSVCAHIAISYASSETGPVAAGRAEELDLDRGDVGRILPGVEVEIVDEETGQPVSGTAGKVRIRSKGVVQGYYREFGRDDAHFDGGWFYPGDIGTLSSDGMLSIAGRADNVLNIGGIKTTFDALEAELAAAPAVKQAAVSSVSDHLGINRIVAYVVPAAGWSEQAFWNHCRKNLGRPFMPVKVVLLTGFPRGPGGKVDRKALPSVSGGTVYLGSTAR